MSVFGIFEGIVLVNGVSFVDIIVLVGNVGVEIVVKVVGFDVEVFFILGCGDVM